MFLLEGLTGAFFQPLALAYTLAILASLVVALTVTPALCLIMLRNATIERRESPVVRRLQRGYTGLLGKIIRRPSRVYAGTGRAPGPRPRGGPHLGQALLPHFKERDFLMHWVAQPGTSSTEMQRITLAASEDLMAIPGVRNFAAHLGQAFQGDEPYGINFGENWISIDPHVDYDDTIAAIDAVVADYPGLFRDRKTYLDERTKEVVAGGSEPIVVRLFGHDLHTLGEQAQEMEDILGGIDGVVNEHIDLHTDVPQIDVEVDLERAAQYGLKPGDVRRAAAVMVASEEVGDIFRGGRAYDVVVWSVPEARDSVPDIENLLIDTPSGQRIQLSDVAAVAICPSPNSIDREDGSRHLDILADVEGVDIGTVGEELEDQLEAHEFPRGYHVELLGEFEEQQAAQTRLFTTGAIALAVIFLLLTGRPGQLAAGAAVLRHPAARAHRRGAGGVRDRRDPVHRVARRVLHGVRHRRPQRHPADQPRPAPGTGGGGGVRRRPGDRGRPGTAGADPDDVAGHRLALVPLVMFGERPGQEIEHPLAVVILGGLFTSTLLSLFVIPALYLRFGKSRREREAGGDGGDDVAEGGGPRAPA